MGIHQDLKNLPGCVALVAHLLILFLQLLALPFALLVALAHVVLCWPVFHSAVEVESGDAAALQLLRWRLVWHAVCWPMRAAVAVGFVPATLVPLAGAGYAAWWATGESVVAGICGALLVLVMALVGGRCIVQHVGVFHLDIFARMTPPRKKDMLVGGLSALLDVGAFVCFLFVVGTVLHLPGFVYVVHRRWRTGKLYKGRGLRRELGVQASLAVLDVLCLPLLLLVWLTRLRVPRLYHRWNVHFSKAGSKGMVGKFNSWNARVIVIVQTLYLIVIDAPTMVALAAVTCTGFRLRPLRHGWVGRLDQTVKEGEQTDGPAVQRSLWRTMAANEFSMHSVIWTQLLLVVADIICAPFAFLLFITGVRLPRLLRKWRTQRERRKQRLPRAAADEGAAYREMNRDTLCMRLSALLEATLIVLLDLPTLLALAIVVCTVYRVPALWQNSNRAAVRSRNPSQQPEPRTGRGSDPELGGTDAESWELVAPAEMEAPARAPQDAEPDGNDVTRRAETAELVAPAERRAPTELNPAHQRAATRSELWAVLGAEKMPLHQEVWIQLGLIILDVIFAPCLLIVFLTGIRLPNLQRKWREATSGEGQLESSGHAYRALNKTTLKLRLSAGKEVLILLLCDLPVLCVGCGVCCTLYRALPLVRDLKRLSKTHIQPQQQQQQQEEEEVMFAESKQVSWWMRPWCGQGLHDLLSDPAAEWRAVVLQHMWLSILDLLTLAAFVVCFVPPYGWLRLPKTIAKLCGCKNVSDRESKHWSYNGLVLSVYFGKQASEARQLRACSKSFLADRWNWYILKRALKVLLDLRVLIVGMVIAPIAWRWPLILADLKRLNAYRTPSQQRAHYRVARDRPAPEPVMPDGAALRAMGQNHVASYFQYMLGVWLIVISLITWFHRAITAADREDEQRAADKARAALEADSSQSISDEEDLLSFSFNRSGGSQAGILLVAGAVMGCCCCCWCCCYFFKNNPCNDDDGCDCSCDDCGLFSKVSRLDHGVKSWQRQRCQVSVLLYHVLMAPVDILIELPALLLATIIVCTYWRYPSMSRKAGSAFTLRDWELKRTQRLKAVLSSVYQWLQDLPAIPALVILLLTCVRAHPTLQELSDWRRPERANARRRANEPKEFAKLQLALKEQPEGGTSIRADGGRSSKLARVFDIDMSVELVHAKRRLSIGYMLHERLVEDSLTRDLPVEVVEQMAIAIAFNGRTIYRVPEVWPKGKLTLDELLPLMPPDATVLLAPGLHRIHLELLRPNLVLRGTGEKSEDTMLVPFEYRYVAKHRQLMSQSFATNMGGNSATVLNNLTLMHEPTLPYDKYRVHPGEGVSEDQVQWRTLIWRQFALLALDLPWPFMAVLTGWRIWQLCREVNRKNLLYERWQRTVITLRHIGWAMLDIPVLVLWIVMACTVWRLPTLRRIHQNLGNEVWHGRIAVTFMDWVFDIPFVLLALTVMPWRLPVMVRYLCIGGNDVPPDRFDVFSDKVFPWQRLLVLRFAALSLLDLLSIGMSGLLLLFPWRLRQVRTLVAYEQFCAQGEFSGFVSWRMLSHENKALRPSWLRKQTFGGGGARSHTQTAKAAEWSQSLQLSRWTQFLDSLVAVVIPLVCCGIIDLLVLVVSAIAVVLAPWVLKRMYRETMATLESRPGGRRVGRGSAGDITEDEMVPFSLRVEHAAYTGCGPRRRTTMRGAVVVDRSSDQLISRSSDGLMGYWSDDKGGILNASELFDAAVENTRAEKHAHTATRPAAEPDDGPAQDEQSDQLAAVLLLLQDRTPLYLFAPRVSATFFWPLARGWIAQAIWDSPHWLLLPFKLLAILLTPVLWWLKSRMGVLSPLSSSSAEAQTGTTGGDSNPVQPGQSSQTEQVPAAQTRIEAEQAPRRPDPPNLSWFLSFSHCGRGSLGVNMLWVGHHSTSVRKSHERGFALLCALVLLTLDALSTILYVAHLVFPLVFTLFSPLWRKTREELQFFKLGRLWPASPGWLKGLHVFIVVLQLVGGPLFLCWVVAIAVLPVVIQILADCPEHFFADHCLNPAGWWDRVALWAIALMFPWAAVVVSSVQQKWTYCRRNITIYSPIKAWRICATSVVETWQPYKSILVCATQWSYQRRECSRYFMVGEFTIPVVLAIWAFWPAALSAGLAVPRGESTPGTVGQRHDGSESMQQGTLDAPAAADCMLCGTGGESWGAGQVITLGVGVTLSLVLTGRALRVVSKYWQPQLTAQEQTERDTPKISLESLRVELPSDGSGFVLHVVGFKPVNFTARRVRLLVEGENFWTGLALIVGRKARAILPVIRRRALPVDLVDQRCFDPVEGLERGKRQVDTSFYFGVSSQSTRVKSRTVIKFLRKLCSPDLRCELPVANVRIEYKGAKHWSTLLYLQIDPRELLRALDDIIEKQESVHGYLNADSDGKVKLRQQDIEATTVTSSAYAVQGTAVLDPSEHNSVADESLTGADRPEMHRQRQSESGSSGRDPAASTHGGDRSTRTAPASAPADAAAERDADSEETEELVFNAQSPWNKYTRDTRSFYFNTATKVASLSRPAMGIQSHHNPYASSTKFEARWKALHQSTSTEPEPEPELGAGYLARARP